MTQFASQLTQVENSISQTIDAMKRQRNEVDSINGGHNNATINASNSLASRINEEIRKKQKAVCIEKQASAFFNDTIAIDKSVANIMKSNQKQFFDQYSWLKPGIDIPGIIEDCKKWLKNTWNSAKDKIAKVWDAICDWVSEHWVELLIGTIAIIIGVIAVVFTSGIALLVPALLAALKTVGISMLISGLLEGTISVVNGENFCEGFGDGLASGYMFGGILAGVSQIIASSFTLASTKFGVTREGIYHNGNFKIFSPNTNSPNPGGTFVKFNRNIHFDFEATDQLFHTHMKLSTYNKLPNIIKMQKWLINVPRRSVHIRLIPIMDPIISHYYNKIKQNN